MYSKIHQTDLIFFKIHQTDLIVKSAGQLDRTKLEQIPSLAPPRPVESKTGFISRRKLGQNSA
jgi:hypothetical protein